MAGKVSALAAGDQANVLAILEDTVESPTVLDFIANLAPTLSFESNIEPVILNDVPTVPQSSISPFLVAFDEMISNDVFARSLPRLAKVAEVDTSIPISRGSVS